MLVCASTSAKAILGGLQRAQRCTLQGLTRKQTPALDHRQKHPHHRSERNWVPGEKGITKAEEKIEGKSGGPHSPH